MIESDQPPSLSTALLNWYDRHARRLPWRIGPAERARGQRPDPYRVWLSEVMLQQTTVAAVKPYFETFVTIWPDVASLAGASRDDVMKAWAGLGYYSRARNLHACAQIVATKHEGRFPLTAEELKALPGIGDYTAAAIAAIAYDESVAVVDGNIERVITRLDALDKPLPAGKKAIRARQAALTPEIRAGDYAQAMMDLGASICTPKRPACSLCPLAKNCVAFARGEQERYPVKPDRTRRPTRFGTAYVAQRSDGAVLLRKRPDAGLLGGMAEVPGSEWTREPSTNSASDAAPIAADWQPAANPIVHVFTHFRLELTVYKAAVDIIEAPHGTWWSSATSLPSEALPSAFKKAIESVLPGATKPKRKTRSAT
ncbi:MAG: A/G-specific adenine glycosylase [Hyphomicrobiales bacterium]|nr:A/G-specific adenine glycosylase [Hyphomicrobiales bacterium]